MKDVIIIGVGGHAKVVADIVQCSGDNILGFLADFTDDNTFLNKPILGKDTDYKKFPNAHFIIAIGDPHVRELFVSMMHDIKWYTAIHPNAIISSIDTCIGEGSVIMANAVINPSAHIGKHCIINTGAIVEHDNRISDFVHISVGAKLAGKVSIGQRTWIGVGATVRDEITICDNCMIGAGSVIISNIDKSGTYVGIPASKIK